MILKDYHVHSCYCDGKDSPEDIVKKAIEMGMSEIGILAHSFTSFDTSWCIKKEKIKAFKAEINTLKEKYRDSISVLCGVEQDFYSDAPTDGFDYVIGSVHYIKCGDEYCQIDENADILKDIAKRHFNGDFYAFAECYFETVARLPEVTRPTVIGHFDLISKFNEKQKLFSETDSRYIQSCKSAIDRLIPYGIPFEVNTGAISRGYKTTPYPSADIINYIKAKGGKLILSSDSHSMNTLCFEFEKYFDKIG